MERLQEENGPMEMEPVVFHGEPRRTSGQGFQELLKSLGYHIVVVRPRSLPGSGQDVRCVPLHVASYLFPRIGRFTHFDFVAGDVDYSPITSYLISNGLYVKLWLFGDRIPTFGQDEEVSHGIIPLNEKYILAEKKSSSAFVQERRALNGSENTGERIDRALDLGTTSKTGCEEI